MPNTFGGVKNRSEEVAVIRSSETTQNDRSLFQDLSSGRHRLTRVLTSRLLGNSVMVDELSVASVRNAARRAQIATRSLDLNARAFSMSRRSSIAGDLSRRARGFREYRPSVRDTKVVRLNACVSSPFSNLLYHVSCCQGVRAL